MVKKNLIFVVFVLAVLGLLWLVSGTKAPYLPADEPHRDLSSVPAGCRECHAPGKEAPLKEKHPPKDPCLKCHHPASGKH